MAHSSTSNSHLLAFGPEMEFLIRPRQAIIPQLVNSGWNINIKPNSTNEKLKETNKSIMRAEIANSLREFGISAGLTTTNYGEWSVVDERSLDEANDFWRVEIISKILLTTDDWQTEVEGVFLALNAGWQISLTTGCSMHVHVSPGITDQDVYSTPQIRRIMKAIAFYDDAITKIMPADRKNNQWAMSNFRGQDAPNHLQQAYAAVPTRTWAPLFARFDQLKMKQMVHMEFGQSRYLSWNFSNLTAQCGTVEFRRPPAVQTATAAKHWAGVALGFVSEAIITDFKPHCSHNAYGRIDSLQRFISDGVKRLGGHCQRAVIFENLVEDRNPPTVYSAAQLQVIARKKLEKNQQGSPFATKANSRPSSPASRTSSPGARSNASSSSSKRS
ncbi:hypothetical protein GGR58DRAFT_257353 [Xylaria digitata]|nr:hypothetical protein GGR58DRAFT_257353 [Xylaria digitata]